MIKEEKTNMKKYIAVLLALVMVLGLAACGGSSKPADSGSAGAAVSVAMVTDYGDITDQSFNQTTYEACKAYCEANSLKFSYYKPASDSDDDRIAAIEKAIDDGFNVVVMPGYAFAGAIAKTAPTYADVTFIALDVSEFDLTSAGLDPLPANLYSAVYQEELCGYMAGYAAVKLGYTKLGYVFACGGGIYSSAAEAAAKVGGKVIGVDVDQAAQIDGTYGEGMTVTSAMKGLAATVNTMLGKVVAGTFEGGKVENLGLVSAVPEENYVQIAGSTQFADGFTRADYEALVADMFAGKITVSNDIENAPAVTAVSVDYQGNIK